MKEVIIQSMSDFRKIPVGSLISFDNLGGLNLGGGWRTFPSERERAIDFLYMCKIVNKFGEIPERNKYRYKWSKSPSDRVNLIYLGSTYIGTYFLQENQIIVATPDTDYCPFLIELLM